MSDFPTSSGFYPESLGEYLRSEREKRGISLEQLSSATKISLKTLHLLEADHYLDLPAKPFIRGFVNSYSRFLGLDSRAILTQYDAYLTERVKERPHRESGLTGYAFERREGEQSKTILWIVMGAFLFTGLIAFIIFKPELKRHKHGKKGSEKLIEAHTAAPVPQASPTTTQAPTPVAAPSTEAEAKSPLLSVLPLASAPTPSGASKTNSELDKLPRVTRTADQEKAHPLGYPPPESPSAKDPFNSGKNIKSSSVGYRILFQVKKRTVFRFQTDGRPVTELAVGEGRQLVLKAIEVIRVQIREFENVEMSIGGAPYQPIDLQKNAVQYPGGASLVFPKQLAEIIKDPFSGQGPIPYQPTPIKTQSVEEAPSEE